MSKVALRVYNREIETLIDQGHLEEAIAHCQHILKIYPKHLESYRLLGKAYLNLVGITMRQIFFNASSPAYQMILSLSLE